MALGEIKTGMVSTLRNDAADASAKAAALVAKETEEMRIVKLTDGQLMYQTIGEPVLNCSSKKGVVIEFKGGCFICERDDEDIISALAHFVKIKRIKIITEEIAEETSGE